MVRGLLAGIRVAGADRDRQPLEALAANARDQGNANDLLTKLPPEQAAEKARAAPVAWTSIATMPITPSRSQPSLVFPKEDL